MTNFVWNIIERLTVFLMWTLPGPAEHKQFKISISCKTYTWTRTLKHGERLR